MGLVIRIAWRNLWRNPRRSAILISAIVVCIASLILTFAYINGILQQMVQNSIEFHTGEMEVYAKDFNEDNDPARHINEPSELLGYLEGSEGVRAFAPRVEGKGLISSSYSSSGVHIVGIVPDMEGEITLVRRSVIDGNYLSERQDHLILIGEKMASRLEVGIGDKVVITVQTVRNELASDAYRVAGIFRTISRDFDKYMVYIPIQPARKLLDIKGEGITGIAVRTEGMDVAAGIKAAINGKFGSEGVEALTLEELEPLIMEMVRISKQWTFLFFIAVFIILSIGIINTQNIAVYERMHELGVIRAMGTRPRFIFAMVMMETLFLGVVGAILGFVLSYPPIHYFSTNGLNLAVFSEGLQMLGIASTIYFDLKFIDVAYSALSVIITSAFGAFLPALRAGRLKPVEAIRYL